MPDQSWRKMTYFVQWAVHNCRCGTTESCQPLPA